MALLNISEEVCDEIVNHGLVRALLILMESLCKTAHLVSRLLPNGLLGPQLALEGLYKNSGLSVVYSRLPAMFCALFINWLRTMNTC